MALSLVQSTNYNSGSSTSASGIIVYSVAPTQGDLLLAGLSYAGTKHPSAAPGGWTQLDDLEVGTNAWLTTYYHVVGASETNSYTFTTTGGDFFSIVAFDIKGQHTVSPINQHAIGTGNVDPTVTPSVTPSVVGCLALAFVAYNDGTVQSAVAATAGAGWTVNQNPQPDFHSCVGASKNALTSDTVTAITASITWGGGDNEVASTILIAPPAAAPSFTPRRTLLGVG